MQKSFPFYNQHDAMDCGPTCLQMIAAWYGRKYSLQKLRELSFCSKEGVSLLGISMAAEKIGFRTNGIQLSFDKLLNEVPLPCIVHWNQKHFVVVYEIIQKKKNKETMVLVADPAQGKIKYTQYEFTEAWHSSRSNGLDTGVVLIVEPTPLFYQLEDNISDNKRGWGFILSYLKPYKKLVVQLFIGLIIASLLQLMLPFLTQSLVDFGISNQNIHYIYLVLIAQLVLTLSNVSVEFIRGWILLHMGTRVNISLISDFLVKLMKLPISYFDTKMTGDILQRINDHIRIKNFLTNSSLGILFSMFNILIFGVVILIYSRLIFSIFFVGSLLYVAWVWMFMKKRAELDHKSFAQYAANQSNIIQLVSGMQEIKLSACEQQKRWDWEHIQAKLYKLSIKGLALGQYQESGGVLINQVKNITITALVAGLVVKGHITLGMMLSIQYIIGQLNSPVEQIISFMRQIQDAKLSMDRLQDIHQKENEELDEKSQIQDIPFGLSITVKNMAFSYDPLSNEATLSDINLIIPSGKQTAVVGMSGSGKTTLIKMLLGFYPPAKGEILLGNTNLYNYNIRQWRKKCGVVMQDGFIFSDSIADNIAPGVDKIDSTRLREATDIANIREYIEQLPLNYNTKIGLDGHGLSQGQKQRILIARAVYKNPEFIFFDEATNSLDANNELQIMNNLHSFFKGKTSVIVAHRLSTVKNADQIIVLEKGCIAEIGNHQTLIDKKGIYYKLVKNQLNL